MRMCGLTLLVTRIFSAYGLGLASRASSELIAGQLLGMNLPLEPQTGQARTRFRRTPAPEAVGSRASGVAFEALFHPHRAGLLGLDQTIFTFSPAESSPRAPAWCPPAGK